MYDTISNLVSEVMSSLGSPSLEILHPKHVVEALSESFALRGLTAQQSAEGRYNKSVPIVVNSRDTLLSQAADIALPSYVERRAGSDPFVTWVYVPSCDKSLLEEARGRGEERCAFYRAGDGRWRLMLSDNPTGITYRLNYYSDPAIIATLEDPLPLPIRFATMFKYDTQINVVPGMMSRAAQLPPESQLNSAQLQAISAVLAHASTGLEKWEPLWKRELEGNKNPRGRFRRSLLSHGGPMIRRTY